MGLQSLLILAVVIEGIVGYSKLFFVERKFQWQVMVAIAMGILLALVYKVDLFAILKMETSIPYIGNVLTGLLVARGSNYIADLIKLIGAQVERMRAETRAKKEK